jgi:hypothetical protein
MGRDASQVFKAPPSATQPVLEGLDREKQRVVVGLDLPVPEAKRLGRSDGSHEEIVRRKSAQSCGPHRPLHVDLPILDVPGRLPECRLGLSGPTQALRTPLRRRELATPDEEVDVAEAVGRRVVQEGAREDAFDGENGDPLAFEHSDDVPEHRPRRLLAKPAGLR